MGIDYRPAGAGGGNNGLTIVSDDAGRTGLTPVDGTAVYQKDTKELWIWTGGSYPTGAWSLFGRVNNIVFGKSTSSVSIALGTNAGAPRTGEPVTLTATVNLSAAVAAAGSTLVEMDIQADGLRAQILNSAVRALFSVAAAPLTYNSATGVFTLPVSSDGVDGYLSGTDHTALTTVIAGLATEVTNRTNGDSTNATNLTNHINSTTAHSAAHITNAASGNVTSTDVQSAINELQTHIDTINSANHGDVTLGAVGSSPNSNAASLSTQVLTLQPADNTHPGVVSTATQAMAGAKSLSTSLAVGTTSAAATSTIFQVVSTTLGSIPEPVMTSTQRLAISTPATGLKVYDSTLLQSFYFNGTNWEPERGFAVPGATTVADGANFTPGNYRKQIQLLGGASSALASVPDVLVTNAQIGDELVIVGNDNTNVVTLNSGTHVTLFGSCTLGLNDNITLRMITASMWQETARSS